MPDEKWKGGRGEDGKVQPGNEIGKDNRFKPGQSGNPGGKPVGARNRLATAFLRALATDFERHGKKAIRQCREERPDNYLRVIAALMPKEVELKRPLQEMEDAELIAALRTLEGFLGARAATEGAGGSSESPTTH